MKYSPKVVDDMKVKLKEISEKLQYFLFEPITKDTENNIRMVVQWFLKENKMGNWNIELDLRRGIKVTLTSIY